MLRKAIVGVAVAVTLGATTLIPTDASAHYRRHGFYVRPAPIFLYRPFPIIRVAPYRVSCWRWVPTRRGYVKAWVC
jgi:hypothetical protein